ncbi:HAD family hydrolase [Oxalobacteraceae bacterium CAVE-383]|nr:HAD family hydrolase [Oxalobacteraceae bacterium CAVE-383]
MTTPGQIVFLFDCDNTLLDNDRIQADLRDYLTREFGQAECDRYWRLFEQLRAQLGYVDYLGAVQLFRADATNNAALLQLSAFLLDYPFAERLYPGALDIVARVGAWGKTVILSDGDMVFQPRKLQRSGLWQAVGGRVLIYIHKEKMLEEMQRAYPADRYVMIDDKLSILTAIKAILKERVTTVFPRQGHYADEALMPDKVGLYPAADISIDRIADLKSTSLEQYLR